MNKGEKDSNRSKTLHAPGERLDNEIVKRQMNYFNKLPLFKKAFDCMNGMVFIINRCRQVVFANKGFLKVVKVKDILQVVGKRPGEIIKCINADNGINGCGTGEACKYCSAVNTILTAMEIDGECSSEFSNINRINDYEMNFNLLVHVSPMEVDGEMFYVVSLTDIGDSTRMRIYQRVFFHDIINKAGALRGIVGLLKEDVPEGTKSEVEFVEKVFSELVDEIKDQKSIMDAENNDLIIGKNIINTAQLLKSISTLYEKHEAALNKTIRVAENSSEVILCTDERLLKRILENMITNALEATEELGTITFGCSIDAEEGGFAQIWVHNNVYMNKKIQSLIFHRSLSTKGSRRGLGTYSMKLFGEKFLKGKVDFTTSKGEGTTFYIELPIHQIPAY